MQEQYRICARAKANPRNTIIYGNFRITLLTEQLVRLEYNEVGAFADMPSQIIWHRDFPETVYQVCKKHNGIRVETGSIVIWGKQKGKSLEDIEIIRKKTEKEKEVSWHFDMQIKTLKGTIRTLDMVDGEIPLDEGLLSKEGMTIIDDSNSYLILENGELQKRCGKGKDLYIFAYGHNYAQCLKDFFRLTGNPPLLPRYALGNWWSRFHRYNEQEYLELMDCFAKKGIPLSVAMIDMDWHLTKVEPRYGSGWTGYTWNRELFREPETFLKKLHDRDLKVSLNVHPAEGVRAFEEPYAEMIAAIGEELCVNAKEEEPIGFDATNPVFLEAYFKYLHTPNEKRGVDFWWIDWQQGETSDLPGLDPLWVLNHYHYLDNAKKNKRPMILSRYAGLGSHRYPVGFSGDTVISWESLDFQPYFTATASNVGYGWWSHDIGGHMLGSYDEELQIRWLQWGVFSPINRMHSSCSIFNHKEPWNYSQETSRIMSDYLRLRHQLIPYLYTMNWLSHKEGKMLIQPMYYHYPEKEEAYQVPNEYFFGTQLICLPITSPLVDNLKLAKVRGWLPEGTYIDWQRGTVYEGNRFLWFYRRLDEIPLLLKAGAIMVCSEEAQDNKTDNPVALSITVAAGDNGRFTLYEDDGETFAYEEGESVYTDFYLDYSGQGEFHICAARGKQSLIPAKRQYRIRFLGFEMTGAIVRIINEREEKLSCEYHESKNELEVFVEAGTEEEVIIRFKQGMKLKQNNIEKMCFDVLDKAQIAYTLKEDIYRMIKNKKEPEAWKEIISDEDLYGALAEAIYAQGEGQW